MELFLIYAWMKLDDIGTALGISSFFCFAFVVILLIAKAVEEDDLGYSWTSEDKKERIRDFLAFRKKWNPRLICAGIFLALSSILIPSSNQAAILVGSHYALEFAKSPTGAKIGKLLEAKVNQALDEQLKEIEKTVPAEVQKAASQVQNATK